MFNRSGAGNYAYTSARVRAKKAKLLKEEDYNKLLMMTVPEISHYISEAGYSKEMLDLANRYSGLSLLEHATSANMSKEFRSILKSATGDLNTMVGAYINGWDFENLKIILRGKNYGLPADKIRDDLIPAGRLGSEDLEKIISSPSLEDALSLYKAKTGDSVKEEVLSSYRATLNFGEIEDALTKEYYASLLAAVKGKGRAAEVFRNYLRYVVDAKNIETVLKLKVEGITGEVAMKYFIPGGAQVDEKVMAQLAAAPDVLSAANEMQQLKMYAEIKDSLTQNTTIIDVVAAIDRYIATLANKVGIMYPLSVLPIVDYIIHKENEVRNIRMIAHGIDSGLDRETMKNLLVI